MKKNLSLILIYILLITTMSPPLLALELNQQFYREYGKKALVVAGGISALYIFNKVNQMMDDRQQSEEVVITDQPGRDEVNRDMSNKIIVLDPGHGGRDPGAIGSTGLQEKDINLDIALHLRKLLINSTGARVYLTRDKDVYLSLAERAGLANKLKADIFISLHTNADIHRQEQGVETYAHYNACPRSWALAWYVQESLVRKLKLANRGLKVQNFQVIRQTPSLRSILVETGFISHPVEEQKLATSSFREQAT
ncbi:MAG: N-acetylmuramoyl-L-alanine amidase family protein, partial [Bacillota bacterium]